MKQRPNMRNGSESKLGEPFVQRFRLAFRFGLGVDRNRRAELILTECREIVGIVL